MEGVKEKKFMNNKVYDTLKIVAAILPLIGAFYYGLSEIWGLPYGGPVQATFALLASTLAAILAKLSYDYKKYNDLKALLAAGGVDAVADQITAENTPEVAVEETVESGEANE